MKKCLADFIGGLMVCGAAMVVQAQEPAARGTSVRGVTPWGISSSASSFRNHAEWFPKMAEAGVSTVRLFPEWRGFESPAGQWKWNDGDLLVKSASQHRLQINAVLMGSPPSAKSVHAFPMEHLPDWSRYVEAVVGRYKNDIRYWEVWNEGNGGFNDGKHTTADYAKLAVATYEAAKKADPQAKVGVTVASFDAAYLQQTMRAMTAAGKPGSFDYLCVHPYEIADGLFETDGEVPFLWMGQMLRSVLKTAAHEKAEAELWMTEVGHRLSAQRDRSITENDAAMALAKIYTMALAQGFVCTQWFEAQDPIGEDQGFGLIARNGTARPALKTFKTLTAVLGERPQYIGWTTIGSEQRGYGFVFEGRSARVLVAWMPAGLKQDVTQRTLDFGADVDVANSLTGATSKLAASKPLELTEVPTLISGIPNEVVQQARENAAKNFPWGGDFSRAKTASFEAGQPDKLNGVVPRNRSRYPTVTFADGSSGLVLPGDIGHPISFYAHPSFASLQTDEYFVRATVRRLGSGNVGMNLRYEVADSQGGSAYANVGQWFGVGKEGNWQTYTWRCSKACFAKMWGHDIVIAPEQSVPFVLGKIEISTQPF